MKLRLRRLILLLAVTGVVVGLSWLVVVVGGLVYTRWCPDHGWRVTHEQLMSVHVNACAYARENGEFPGADFDEFINGVADYSRPNSGKTARLIRSALSGDGWGRPYVFEMQEGGLVFRLRSVGPNGRDEEGSGDDYEIRADHRR